MAFYCPEYSFYLNGKILLVKILGIRYKYSKCTRKWVSDLFQRANTAIHKLYINKSIQIKKCWKVWKFWKYFRKKTLYKVQLQIHVGCRSIPAQIVSYHISESIIGMTVLSADLIIGWGWWFNNWSVITKWRNLGLWSRRFVCLVASLVPCKSLRRPGM